MRAVIYARRSTDDHQAASLDVQEEEGRRFCSARGWQVWQVIKDDGVSRSEFKHRPGLIRMLAAASEKPRPFDVVVLRDETRLGGDLYRTGMILQDLHDAGVQVYYFATGEAVSFNDPTAKFLAAARLFASELEREKIASRVREHLQGKARRGLNVGGRVYGYNNDRHQGADGRAWTDYSINEQEAAVVRWVYEQRARGVGYRSIVDDLNQRGVPSPRAGKRGSGSWSPSALYSIAHNERYRGILVWGRRGSEYRGGTRVEVARTASEQVRAERPELRIISEELWAATRAQDESFRPRPKRAPARYLLSGIARCALCGGPMQVSYKKSGKINVPVYLCGWARDRGMTVCTNSLRRPIEELEAGVLDWMQGHVFDNTVLTRVLEGVRARLEVRTEQPDTERQELSEELRRVQVEIERLADVLTRSDSPPEVLLRRLTEREKRAGEVRARLAGLNSARPARWGWAEVEEELRKRLGALKDMLRRNLPQARKALETLLRPNTLKCMPVTTDGRRRFLMTAEVVVTLPRPPPGGGQGVRMEASPEGFEPSLLT